MNTKLFKSMTPFLMDKEAHDSLHVSAFRASMWDTLAVLPPGLEWYAKLADFATKDPEGAQWRTMGLIQPLGAHKEDAPYIEQVTGRSWMLYVQFNEKVLPGSVRDEKMREKVQELEAKEGRALNKSEYCQVRDVTELALLKTAFIKRTIVPALITADGLLLIMSGSSKRVDDAGALLRQAIPFLKTTLVDPELGYDTFLRSVSKNPYYWQDSLEHDGELIPGYGADALDAGVFVGKDKKTVRIKDLDIYSVDAQHVVTGGYEPKQLRLAWYEEKASAQNSSPEVVFELTDKGVFKNIKIENIKVDGQERDSDDNSAMAQITADWMLVGNVYSDLVHSLVKVCGGFRTVSFLEEAKPAPEDDEL